jgi:hypothetical protein
MSLRLALEAIPGDDDWLVVVWEIKKDMIGTLP